LIKSDKVFQSKVYINWAREYQTGAQKIVINEGAVNNKVWVDLQSFEIQITLKRAVEKTTALTAL